MLRWPLAVVFAMGGCGEPEQENVLRPTPAIQPAPTAPAPPAPHTPAPLTARVFFVEPADGAKVHSPFTVKFGIDGMGVRPAGDPEPNTGHHHLIINGAAIDGGQQVPKDEKHIHYGKGQTEAVVELAPGEYTLTMQFADPNHLSFGGQMAATIRVTVE